MLNQTINIPLAAWFVSPWFVAAGAALASIPIVIHILNRRRFKVVKWAAMEYLLQAMRKNRRRLKFEQWLLLAMRCLLIFFMGLALARPLGCDNSAISALAGQRTSLHVIIIDNSYSMAYEAGREGAKTHLDQAKLLAKKIIDRVSSGNESVMIITASSPIDKDRATDPHAATPKPTYDLQTARNAIDRIEQTSAGTDLNGALQLAIRVAKEETRQPRKQLYILTDATKSAFELTEIPKAGEQPQTKSIEALKQTGQEIAKLYGKPWLFPLGKQGQWNQAVLDVSPMANLVTTEFTTAFAAMPKGYGAGPDPVLQWTFDDRPLGAAKTVKLDLDTQPQSVTDNKPLEGGQHIVTVSLAADDRLKLDNQRLRVVDVVSELKVLIVEGDRGLTALSGSGSLLELALSPPKEADPERRGGGRKSLSAVAVDPLVGEIELANKVLANYRAVMLTNIEQFTANQAEQLKTYVNDGGTLMFFMGPRVKSDNYNTELATRGLLPGRLVKIVSNNEQPAQFDFNPTGNLHPLLKEFRGQEKSGLTTAGIWNYWQLELPGNSPAERVLDYKSADGKSKDPAITAHSLGKGRVIFFSTTANAEWNELPPKPAFVTLMGELVRGSVGSGDRWMNLTVGERVEVPAGLGLTAAPQLFDATKQAIVMESVTSKEGVTTYRSGLPLSKPGVYSLQTGARTYPIAVNPPSSEADVRIISPEAIRKALGDIDLTMEEEGASVAALRIDPGNDLSWTFMMIVLILAGLECFLAMRFGHYKRGTRQGSPQLATGN